MSWGRVVTSATNRQPLQIKMLSFNHAVIYIHTCAHTHAYAKDSKPQTLRRFFPFAVFQYAKTQNNVSVPKWTAHTTDKAKWQTDNSRHIIFERCSANPKLRLHLPQFFSVSIGFPQLHCLPVEVYFYMTFSWVIHFAFYSVHPGQKISASAIVETLSSSAFELF